MYLKMLKQVKMGQSLVLADESEVMDVGSLIPELLVWLHPTFVLWTADPPCVGNRT